VLKGRLTPAALDQVLREVGRSLAASAGSDRKREGLETRIKKALGALEAIGGAASLLPLVLVIFALVLRFTYYLPVMK
jgi:hypothetical protein